MISRRAEHERISIRLIRLAALAPGVLLFPASVIADSYGVSSRVPARPSDLAGPRVDLTGSVVGRFRDGTVSCLLVKVSGTPRTWLAPPLPSQHLVAICPEPGLGEQGTAVGATLRMRGNLGVSQSRRVDGDGVEVAELGAAVVIPDATGGGYSPRRGGANYPGADAYSVPYPYPAPYPMLPPVPTGMGWWGGFYGW